LPVEPAPLRGPLAHLTRQALPCCTLVAMVLRAWVDAEPALTPDAAARRDRVWWAASQVQDRSAPWSSAYAASRLLNGRVELAPAIGRMNDTPPPLTVGRWHVIQRWRGLDGGASAGPEDDCVVPGASGHTYLAHLAADGTVTIVQSSVDRGYRVSTGTWTGTAGLDGYDVAVVTLPACCK
jgi:hypothetical protein